MELKPKIKLLIDEDKFIELNKNPADGMQKPSGHVVNLCEHMISRECKTGTTNQFKCICTDHS